MTKLMIVDDHAVVREGLKQFFSLDDQVEIIAEAENGFACLNVLSDVFPDLIILDFHMPKMNGLEVLEKLKSGDNRKDIKILFFTAFDRETVFLRAMQLGVDGYILKSGNLEELRKAVQVLMDGESYYQENLIQLIDDIELNSDFHKIENLTNREIEVLKHLSLGMYNKEIALKLEISERTVKNHISSIFKKIGVSDRTQAAVFAIRNELVDVSHK